MDKVQNITTKNEETTADPIAFLKHKAKQVRESRAIKPVLVFTALTLGAYLGARQPMRQIAHDVHDVADRSKRIDMNLYTFANDSITRGQLKDERQRSMQHAISESTSRGEEFRFYPGVGVLFVDEDGQPEQRNYGSGTPASAK